MTKLEELAQVIVAHQRGGRSFQMDEDPVFAHRAAEAIARVVLENLKHGNFAMAGAATRITALARWTPHMLWDGVIDAILEEKPDGS